MKLLRFLLASLAAAGAISAKNAKVTFLTPERGSAVLVGAAAPVKLEVLDAAILKMSLELELHRSNWRGHSGGVVMRRPIVLQSGEAVPTDQDLIAQVGPTADVTVHVPVVESIAQGWYFFRLCHLDVTLSQSHSFKLVLPIIPRDENEEVVTSKLSFNIFAMGKRKPVRSGNADFLLENSEPLDEGDEYFMELYERPWYYFGFKKLRYRTPVASNPSADTDMPDDLGIQLPSSDEYGPVVPGREKDEKMIVGDLYGVSDQRTAPDDDDGDSGADAISGADATSGAEADSGADGTEVNDPDKVTAEMAAGNEIHNVREIPRPPHISRLYRAVKQLLQARAFVAARYPRDDSP